MSTENLRKEIDVIHEKIRAESDLEVKMTLMTERDQLMGQLTQAHLTDADFYQKQIKEMEDNSRAKTVQMPYSFK